MTAAIEIHAPAGSDGRLAGMQRIAARGIIVLLTRGLSTHRHFRALPIEQIL